MALETWLVKVKSAISSSFDSVPKPRLSSSSNNKKSSNVGVLAFEVAGIMSKLLHLWQSLSDKNIIRLRDDSISLEGVRKIVSNDESFLLGLACAELAENARLVAKAVSRLSNRCQDPNLRSFYRLFESFANSGHDSLNWVLSNSKDMETRCKKMDRYVTVTAALYKEMEELSVLENGLKKLYKNSSPSMKEQQYNNKIRDLEQKVIWQRQEVKYLKERSLWNRSYDAVVSILVKPVFTVLSRIKLVFGIGYHHHHHPPSYLPRSLSASAAATSAVHPTENNSCSGPLGVAMNNCNNKNGVFFESNSRILKQPPASTLGAAGLALHYANVLMVMEKMIKSPQLVGVDARDDLYSMLPRSIRSSLRGRLRGAVGFSASDPVLAGEWRNALGRILGWLSPLAHNMIKWQSERSFEQQNISLVPKISNNNVLLLQTLYFANKEKTEAAITELLVGLNYIWRFEREMTAKALFGCAPAAANFRFSCLLNNLQNPIPS